ncbi:MAG TPA: aldehyde dehydrogenase family protein [Gaiellaceae bacterium]|jgi:glutamate-5-semialdehyde dehydrogenase|nr:aldehyde dehydrogenase family protein [Gaiellaceae bacterium]
MREQIEAEARAAAAAVGALTDHAVSVALATAGGMVDGRAEEIAAANVLDMEAAAELDEGTRDRLRLDGSRIAAIADQLRELAKLPPLDRVEDAWLLANGLQVEVRRIPIGAVGANFEARPNVAVDVAGQLLKSLNTAVLRTGGAALRTVTFLVDQILRPALDAAGLPAEAVGLVRTPDREGARILVSLPDVLPLVILRGSGETTAALAREAAQHGVRTLAHAEGGGVLYLHVDADQAKVESLITASLDRLGVCNRLNLLLAHTGVEIPYALLERLDITVREPERIGHEWANDPDRIASVTVKTVASLDEAVAIANGETSGLAATIVTEDPSAAQQFLDAYRGTAAYWNAPTRFTDGFALTGAPETGINVDRVPGPRGPVTYRDLYLRQYRVVGDGTQHR